MKEKVSLYVYNRTKAPFRIGSLDLRVSAQSGETFNLSLADFGSVKNWLDLEQDGGRLTWQHSGIEEAAKEHGLIVVQGSVSLDQMDRVSGGLRFVIGKIPHKFITMHFVVWIDEPILLDTKEVPVFAVPGLGGLSFGTYRLFVQEGETQRNLLTDSYMASNEIVLGLSSLREDVVLDSATGRVYYAFCAVPFGS